MKTGIPQWKKLGLILILIYTIELPNVLEGLKGFSNVRQMIHKFNSLWTITEAENKLGVVLNKVDQQMRIFAQ